LARVGPPSFRGGGRLGAAMTPRPCWAGIDGTAGAVGGRRDGHWFATTPWRRFERGPETEERPGAGPPEPVRIDDGAGTTGTGYGDDRTGLSRRRTGTVDRGQRRQRLHGRSRPNRWFHTTPAARRQGLRIRLARLIQRDRRYDWADSSRLLVKHRTIGLFGFVVVATLARTPCA